MSAYGASPPGAFAALDDSRITRFQWTLGAIVFGRIADILGRKKIYGYEVLILAIGALASAFAPNFWFLLICRAVLGVGIGGDYPVSATMVLLGFGAIPGLAVFYLRRQIQETPRFAMAGGAADEAEAAIKAATKEHGPSGGGSAERAAAPPGESAARVPQGALEGFAVLARHRRMLGWLIGTAGAWALLDFCYYGNSISAPEILDLLSPGASLLHNTLVQLLIFAVFAVPGYLAAIALLDRTGRRKIQVLGFAMMALMFLLIGLIPAVSVNAVPFILLYGVSYFFTEFGPNTTTFVYPAEIFPVDVRTTAHGLSAGAGKLGAFAGAYLFPVLLASSLGIRLAEIVAGVVALAGVALTVALLPEPKGRSLEDLSAEALAPPSKVLERAA